MRVIKDRIFLERIKKEKPLPRKLLLVDEPPENKFIVLKIGTGVQYVQEGNIVMTMPYGLTTVKSDDGRDLYVCKEEDVLVIY
jgi:co-chaperonin GroES (HSP10)